jgi:hypothetical protein
MCEGGYTVALYTVLLYGLSAQYSMPPTAALYDHA